MKLVHSQFTSQALPKERKPTAKQKLHNDAISTLAARKLHDREVADKMFAPEMAEIAQLEKKLADLS